MKPRIITLICIIVLAAWVVPAGAGEKTGRGGKESAKKEELKKAADFTLESLEGKKVSLKDYRGRVVLLVFSATWCPQCRREIAHLKKIYSTYGPKGLKLLNIDVQESKRKVGSYVRKNKIPYTVLLDKDAKVALAYGVRGVPHLVLIGRDGKILSEDRRLVDGLLEKLFDERAGSEGKNSAG